MEKEATAKYTVPEAHIPSPVDSVMSPPVQARAWDPFYQAFFSTNGGQVKPRSSPRPGPPLIVRSDLNKDVTTYVLYLRGKWPHFCNAIIYAPWDIRLFFDEFDFQEKGGQFCFNVIEFMRGENQCNLIEFCKSWSNAHQHHFLHFPVLFQQPLDKVFHPNDLERFGTRFLNLALRHMSDTFRIAPGQWDSDASQSTSQMAYTVSDPRSVPFIGGNFHRSGTVHIAGMHRVRDASHSMNGEPPKAMFARQDASIRGPHGSYSQPHRIVSHEEQVMAPFTSLPFERPVEMDSPVGMHPYMTDYVPITASNYHHPVSFGQVLPPGGIHPYHGSRMMPDQQSAGVQLYERGSAELPRDPAFDRLASGAAAFDGQGIANHDPRSTHHPAQREIRHDPDQYAYRGNYGQVRARRNSGTRGARGRGFHSNGSTRRSSGSYANGNEHDNVVTQGRRLSNDSRDGAWKSEIDRSGRQRQAYPEHQVAIEEESSAYAVNRTQQPIANGIESNFRGNALRKVSPSEKSVGASQLSAISTRLSSAQQTIDPQMQYESDRRQYTAKMVSADKSDRPAQSSSRALLVGPKFIGADVENVDTLFVVGFPENTSDKDLFDAISSIAAVSDVKLRKSPQGMAYSFITFFSTADARKVLSAPGISCRGSQLTVEVPYAAQTVNSGTILRQESLHNQHGDLEGDKKGYVPPISEVRPPAATVEHMYAIQRGETRSRAAGSRRRDSRLTVYSTQDARSGFSISQPVEAHPTSPPPQALMKPIKTWANVASSAKAEYDNKDHVQAKPSSVNVPAASSRLYTPGETSVPRQEKDIVVASHPSPASPDQPLVQDWPKHPIAESSDPTEKPPAILHDLPASAEKRVIEYREGQNKQEDTLNLPTASSQLFSTIGQPLIMDVNRVEMFASAPPAQMPDSTDLGEAENQQQERETQHLQVQPSEKYQLEDTIGLAVLNGEVSTTQEPNRTVVNVSDTNTNHTIKGSSGVSRHDVDSLAAQAASPGQLDVQAVLPPPDLAIDKVFEPAKSSALPILAGSAPPSSPAVDTNSATATQIAPVSTDSSATNKTDSLPARARPKSKNHKRGRKQSSENLAKENQKPQPESSSTITADPQSSQDTFATLVPADEASRQDADLSTTMQTVPGAFPLEFQATHTSEDSTSEVVTPDVLQLGPEPPDIEHTAESSARTMALQPYVQENDTKWVLATLELTDWSIDHGKVQDIIMKLPESVQGLWEPQANDLKKQLQVAQDKLAENAKKLETGNKTLRKKLQRQAKGNVECYKALMTELQLFYGKVANLTYQPSPKVDAIVAAPLTKLNTQKYPRFDSNAASFTIDPNAKPAKQFDDAKKGYYKGKQSYDAKLKPFSPPQDDFGRKSGNPDGERPYGISSSDDSLTLPNIDGVLARSRTIDLSKMRDGAGEGSDSQMITLADLGNTGILVCYDRDENEFDALLDQGRDHTSNESSSTSGLSSGTSSVVNGSTTGKQIEISPAEESSTQNGTHGSKERDTQSSNGLGIFNVPGMPQQSPTQRPQSPIRRPQSPTKPPLSPTLRPTSPLSRPTSPPGASRSPGPLSYARVAASQAMAPDKGKGKAKEVTNGGTEEGDWMTRPERSSAQGPTPHRSVAVAAVAGKSRASSSVRSGDGHCDGNGRDEDDWKAGPEGPWGKSGFQAKGG